MHQNYTALSQHAKRVLSFTAFALRADLDSRRRCVGFLRRQEVLRASRTPDTIGSPRPFISGQQKGNRERGSLKRHF